jgi:myo-inositol 2-dehydrogenase/D-chiro-inositol 1-dehydrogenase/scyllo-inositol 2-dehydrogenase (NAD+)
MADGTLGFGILGSGNMARVYADALATQVEGGRFVATALGSRAPGFASEYGAEVEPSSEALLARPDIDVVVITTPHSTHLALGVETARAGKHVYLEKPMALNVAECDAIIAAARDAGVLLTVAKQTRHFQMSMKAKELLDQGAIGELRVVRATSPLQRWEPEGWLADPGEGDRFLDWGAHCCDAFRWFTGSDAVRVYADYANFGGHDPLWPTALVQIRMANGAICQAFMCYEVPLPGIGTNSNNQYFLLGSEGMIEFDLDRVRLGRDDEWETVWELPTWINPLQPHNPRRIGNTARQVQNLIEAVREGRDLAVSGEDGRAAIEMTEAAARSAATGEAVALPLT